MYKRQAHGHDNALGVRCAVVVKQVVLAAGQLADLGHVALYDFRQLGVGRVVGLAQLEVDIRVIHQRAHPGVLRVQGVGAEGGQRVVVHQLGVLVVGQHVDLLDLVAGTEAVEEVQERNTRLDGAQVVDLHGKTVLPGFHDSHEHFLCYATDKEKINFFGIRSLEEMAERTRRYIADRGIKKGEWIQGGGWNENEFDVPVLPSRQDLDKFCPDNPAIFTRTCCSVAVANTAALKAAGIFDDIPTLQDGHIVVDENGVPTGMLHERARHLVYDILTKYTKEQLKQFILDYQKDLLSTGLTTVQTDDFKLWDATIDDILAAYEELDKEGKLNVRFIQQLRLITDAQLEDYLHRHSGRTGDGSEFFKIGAFKLLPDGSLGGKTAALREPYEGDPENKGIFVYDEKVFYDLLEKAYRNGLQLAIHAIGDYTMDVILDCYEKIAAKYPKPDPRFRIIHCQITSEDILDRFARNGVLADIQPLFIRADMEIAEELLGKERVSTSYAWKTMLDKGIHVSGSSDAPVESFDPILAIHCAVTSQNLDGQPAGGWLPQQKLTVQEAVALYTTGSAYTSYEENVKGKLCPGYLADFIVLSQDIFSVPENEIVNTKVEQTYLGGKLVYSR